VVQKFATGSIRSGLVGKKFFEREREVDPDMTVWDSCAMACEDVYKPSHE
jgi:hypothetical protein